MSRNKFLFISLAGFVVSMMFLSALAVAQAPTLQEQLTAQYKLAKMGSDSSGWSVVQEGTLLSVQKGGIIGVPYKATVTRTATFQDGTVHASDVTSGKAANIGGKLCGVLHKCPTTPDAASDDKATKLFKVGDKVYPTKITVDPMKDTVTMAIVACDTCNKTDPPTADKANVVFQFPKGTIAGGQIGPVEDTIGQLFSMSNDNAQGGDQGDQQQGGQQQGGDQGQQAQGGQDQGQAPAQQAQADPVSIDKGMTVDQVEAAMGKPEKKVTIGNKVTYYYKDMKVIFLSGKVSDVQ